MVEEVRRLIRQRTSWIEAKETRNSSPICIGRSIRAAFAMGEDR